MHSGRRSTHAWTSPTREVCIQSRRDEHDARLLLTRANLHGQNDLSAQLKSRTPLPSGPRSNKALLAEQEATTGQLAPEVTLDEIGGA
jgi:hypothetical protein